MEVGRDPRASLTNPSLTAAGCFLTANAREKQNQVALGGMRNPAESVRRMPQCKEQLIRELLYKTQVLWPELTEPAQAILDGGSPQKFNVKII